MKVKDQVSFTWVGDEHNLIVVEDYNGTYPCMGGNSAEITDNNGIHTVHYTLSKATTYYFYCNNPPSHCKDGMQKTVTALAAGANIVDAAPGQYNDPYDQMEIKDCMLGQYQDENGVTSCKTSKTCEVGKYVQNHILSNKNRAAFDRDCTVCANDKYTTSHNAKTCLRCDTGKRSNGDRTGCEDADGNDMHTWLILIIIVLALILTVLLFLLYRRFKKQNSWPASREVLSAPSPSAQPLKESLSSYLNTLIY